MIIRKSAGFYKSGKFYIRDGVFEDKKVWRLYSEKDRIGVYDWREKAVRVLNRALRKETKVQINKCKGCIRNSYCTPSIKNRVEKICIWHKWAPNHSERED